MIAYHFPPLAGSSGIQRTLRFVQHLPKFGWEPLVLSADPRAYERTSDDLMVEVPDGIVVLRAFALDTARHLSIAGHYIGAMARPDRWVSWKLSAVKEGMRMIREFKPQAIWSTYPIATAHLIGAELHLCRSGAKAGIHSGDKAIDPIGSNIGAQGMESNRIGFARDTPGTNGRGSQNCVGPHIAADIKHQVTRPQEVQNKGHIRPFMQTGIQVSGGTVHVSFENE